MGAASANEAREDELLVSRLLRLNAVAQGIVAGLLVGLMVFAATNFLILKGGPIVGGSEVVGPHLALLRSFLIGYSVTFVGSVIGFGWGFAVGFAGGYSVSRLYNWITNSRERHPSDG